MRKSFPFPKFFVILQPSIGQSPNYDIKYRMGDELSAEE